MASLEKVSRQYRGKMASDYDAKRLKQRRWHEEDRIVGEMLVSTASNTVLDMPVGTGRFIPLYRKLKMRGSGLDSSSEMLSQAHAKNRGKILELDYGSADVLPYSENSFDVCVCVRFLNLVNPDELKTVLTEIDRVTRSHLILTVRLGDQFYSNSAMATHDAKWFNSVIKKLGWIVVRDETEPFVKGWHLMHLRRK